jgi:hypothetical protein
MSGPARALAPFPHPAARRPALARAAAVVLAGPLVAMAHAPAAHFVARSEPGIRAVTSGQQLVPGPVRVPGSQGEGPGMARPLPAALAHGLAGAAPAAKARWSIARTPNATGPQGDLNDVSCVSAAWCVAVGSLVNDRADSVAPLAEVWNGARWSVQATPDTRLGAVLLGVSCSSSRACMAVGYTGSDTVAERWNGSTWAIVPTPAGNPDAVAELDGVWCTAADACTAVGESVDINSTTLVEVWNGTRWAVQAAPSPVDAELSGVTCTAADACTAVGSFGESPGPLVEVRHGTRWAVTRAPDPTTGDNSSTLSSVSCASARDCVAVGWSQVGSGYHPLAEVWNGARWVIRATPSPAGGVLTVLAGVSCTSPDACVAVGYYFTDTGQTAGALLTEVWNGKAWHLAAAPAPPLPDLSELTGVSCRTAGHCVAVGGYFNSGGTGLTLAEISRAGSWATSATPTSAILPSYLSGVACTSARACTAVGSQQITAGGYAALIEAWDGARWAFQRAAPSPAGAQTVYLYGVSCPAADRCVAAGTYQDRAGAFQPLAEAWNGATWTRQSVPIPAGATSGFLTSISCTSPVACTAVGTYRNTAGTNVTLADRWDGTAWQVLATPNPAHGSYSILEGVSCIARSDCTAVGYHATGPNTSAALAMTWNGTHWALRDAPDLPDSAVTYLYGVSCTTPAACVAVGAMANNQISPGDYATAEIWNGTAWTAEYAQNPGSSDTLNSVACTAPGACTAVGTWAPDEIDPLAETWNGTTWAVQSTAVPSNAYYTYFYGLACLARSCTAVGNSSTYAGYPATLAETGPG